MYPKYETSEKVDQLRSDEYSHLSDSNSKVCLDYCGFGLFSYLQTLHYWDSCTFSLSEITANLSNHALYGGAESGTVEHDLKTRIMDYLNIPESEYGLVFTVSRGSAFRLLAESYPFHTNKRLLTMFDHESQSVNWMAQTAREKGAKAYNAWFKWPTLKLCSTDLKKRLSHKKRKKKDSAVGLFVFPAQSRVTGSKYSYQWMALAQQNNWHVLLDAGSLGPKDMDSLGLSLFRPEFIITSFYKVFGHDPTGFGCLLIKKSVMGNLQSQSDRVSHSLDQGEASLASVYNEASDGENQNEDDWERREPEIVCSHIDHVNMLGLSKTTTRLRFLINWLVISLLQLKMPETGNLVQIYGPKIKYERGAAVAFNVKDKSKGFVSPEVVLKLAEREGVCLGIGILSHIRMMDVPRNHHRGGDSSLHLQREAGGKRGGGGGYVRFEVVTASLSFLTNFEDVYKLWAFVAKFLNPSFSREGTLPTVVEDEEAEESET
ncbi:hypothetical protein DY000_02034219 [Brassica cretica]|uniref:Aminotransferase class V domain-containing protein n=1 Tax=Brassica cretica TaxID=69181 RepID=A0ABQ7DUI8_BRACR|nr:hypothetical protein DY000_02034219 [Brassica cretica]